jgi:predicted dehydrogenase
MRKIRVGLVGSRFAARFHWEGWRRVYGIPLEVVGVTSLSAPARDAFAREKGIRSFETLEDLCASVDVVDLCTPPESHEEVAVQALHRGKHVIIEKPLTGYFGSGVQEFQGNRFSKETMLREAVCSCTRILAAAQSSGNRACYAENWIYAPAVQKEREILAKSKGQILWMLGEQSHSGSHSPYYGSWRFSGGGSMVGKSCHPLSTALYLKRVEGQTRDGTPILPSTVSARTHEITQLHVTFSDGTVADIFSSELVLGGVHNWLEVICNNHRTRCNLNPIDALETFNPREEILQDVYVTEKIGTKQGWAHPAPDEAWQHGYPQEFQDFVESIYHDREPLSGMELARDTIATIYAGYLSAERMGAEVAIPR